MPLETGTYINSLVASNPAHDDQLSAADSHLRFIKATLLATLPNLTGPMTLTQAALNALPGSIASEATTRGSQDAALQSDYIARIASEASTRNSSDNGLISDYVSRIATEASARATGDTNLQNQLVNFVPWSAITFSAVGSGVLVQLGNPPILFQIAALNLATGSGDIWTFPVPFPHGYWGIYGTSLSGATVPGSVVSVAPLNNNGCRVWLNGPGGPSFAGTVNMLAIGW